MKQKLLILMLLVGASAFSQRGAFNDDHTLFVEIGTDPKILALGTDNQYTKHEQIANLNLKVSTIDDASLYLGAEFNWTNLEQNYTSIAMFLGKKYGNIFNVKRLSILPNFQIGFIWRERILAFENDPRSRYTTSVSGAFNLPVRYDVNDWFALQLTGQVQHATDIEGRLLRHSGFIHAVFKLF